MTLKNSKGRYTSFYVNIAIKNQNGILGYLPMYVYLDIIKIAIFYHSGVVTAINPLVIVPNKSAVSNFTGNGVHSYYFYVDFSQQPV